jgi:hypothetical protein
LINNNKNILVIKFRESDLDKLIWFITSLIPIQKKINNYKIKIFYYISQKTIELSRWKIIEK